MSDQIEPPSISEPVDDLCIEGCGRPRYKKAGRGMCSPCYQRWRRHGSTEDQRASHGGTGTVLYGTWGHMLDRCYNSKAQNYRRYGWRGIAVCAEWQTYPPFRDWALATGYVDGLTIDRIDNDGDYEPGNCQWLSRSEHGKKTSRVVPRDTVDTIRTDYATDYATGGWTMKQLAARFNLNRETVRKIVRRQSYVD